MYKSVPYYCRRESLSLLLALCCWATLTWTDSQGAPAYIGAPLMLSRRRYRQVPVAPSFSPRHHHGDSTVVRHAAPETILAEALADPDLVGAVTQEQLVVGFVAGVFPFVWAAYEFWKRIDTQQRCGVCQGVGLVYTTKTGKELKLPRKCYACGGFLPWQGWRAFWLSNLDIGNGGVLQRPAADYDELSEAAKARRARQDRGN